LIFCRRYVLNPLRLELSNWPPIFIPRLHHRFSSLHPSSSCAHNFVAGWTCTGPPVFGDKFLCRTETSKDISSRFNPKPGPPPPLPFPPSQTQYNFHPICCFFLEILLGVFRPFPVGGCYGVDFFFFFPQSLMQISFCLFPSPKFVYHPILGPGSPVAPLRNPPSLSCGPVCRPSSGYPPTKDPPPPPFLHSVFVPQVLS